MTARRRSSVVASSQNARLRALVRARNLHRPMTTPIDFDVEDAAFLSVIEAAETLVRLIRIAFLAAEDDTGLAWRRRLGVWNSCLDALTADFRGNESTAIDAIYHRLTQTSPEEEG